MNTHRRVFLRHGALALFALGVPPAFLTRSVFADAPGDRRKVLVCIFQRGAVDGLNMVVPFGEAAYYASRTSIAVPPPGHPQGAIDLDGFFGLHPALQPLHDLWRRGEMAVVHAVGSPHETRSHFEAQEYLETATPGTRASEGWLNRVLQHMDAGSEIRALAIRQALPQALQGRHGALAIADLDRFAMADEPRAAQAAVVERLYRTGADDAIASVGRETFDALARIRSAARTPYRPGAGARYPVGDFGRALRQIAQMITADIGLEVAFADIGGWDTHVNQGGVTGQLPQRLGELAAGLRAFYDDLGNRAEDTIVLTMSEFGRTVRENRSRGTDHGHGNCMLAIGGRVRGGRVYGAWPGLEREQLHQGRDLARTTDFRDLFGEVADRHLGATRLDRVFPGYRLDPGRAPGILGPTA